MKKYSAIIAAVLTAAQISQTAFASGYYTEREYQSVSEDELVYSRFDISTLNDNAEKLDKLVYFKGNDDEVERLVKSSCDECEKATKEYTLARLDADREYTEENSKKLVEASSDAIDASQALAKLVEKVYRSEYDSILVDIFGEEALEEYIADIPSDKFYELSKTEEELESEYGGVYGDSDACAELFIKLWNVRNQIAAEEGYENYAEFANAEIYGRDYSEEETEEFSESVLTYFRPIAYKAAVPLSMIQSNGLSVSKDALLERIGGAAESINGELKASYDYMLENKLLDIDYSEKKSPSSGAYTVTLPVINAPYMFISPSLAYEEDATDAAHDVIHEFGHYSAILNDPIWQSDVYDADGGSVIDTCEIQSQGLELLMTKYYGRIFGSEAAFNRYYILLTAVSNVLDGCFYNEWQTAVYKEKNLTVERCNELAAELAKKYYGVEFESAAAQNVWTFLPHNFMAPMYYISYAVSAATALELASIAAEDYGAATDSYMRLSALGACVPYKEATEKSGLKSVFEDGTIRSTANGIIKAFSLGYTDIDNDAWYAESFYRVADIFKGEGTYSFAPNTNITRADFITLIGKMYDEYVGADENYTLTFYDVDPNEECAKYIAWASAEGIVTGYDNDSFGGKDEITREQLVTIMYRLAEFENSETTGYRYPLDGFCDSDAVSDWAENAFGWAVNCGIIDGNDDRMLSPLNSATRAEAAKIASCYIDMYNK